MSWEETNTGAVHTDVIFGRLKFVFLRIVAGATPKDATRSSPNTTVTAAGGGQYNVTFPKAALGWTFASLADGGSSHPGVVALVEAANYTAGTVSIQIEGGGDLAGDDYLDVFIILSRLG